MAFLILVVVVALFVVVAFLVLVVVVALFVVVAFLVLVVVVALFVVVVAFLILVVVVALFVVVVAFLVLVVVVVALFVVVVVAAFEGGDAGRGDGEPGVLRQVLEDGGQGAFLEVVPVDDHEVGGGDVPDGGGSGGEAVRIRARRDHGHDVGVVSGDLLGEVGDDAGGRDNLEALLSLRSLLRSLAGIAGIAVTVVVARARHRDGEREREQQRGPECPQSHDVSHDWAPCR